MQTTEADLVQKNIYFQITKANEQKDYRDDDAGKDYYSPEEQSKVGKQSKLSYFYETNMDKSLDA